eukprot:Em0143g1a
MSSISMMSSLILMVTVAVVAGTRAPDGTKAIRSFSAPNERAKSLHTMCCYHTYHYSVVYQVYQQILPQQFLTEKELSPQGVCTKNGLRSTIQELKMTERHFSLTDK